MRSLAGIILFFFLLPTLVFGAGDGQAFREASLQWRCWYDGNIHIACLVDRLPDTATPPMQPFISYLPAVVRKLRTDPASLRNELIYIPLHTQPYDMGFTALLARSAVCGSRPDCIVNFSSRPPSPREMLALLTRDLRDMGDDILPAAADGEDALEPGR